MAMDNSIKGIESRGRQRFAADMGCDTVEISDEGRIRAERHLEAISMAPEGKWTYYQRGVGGTIYRIRGNDVEWLDRSQWVPSCLPADNIVSGRHYSPLTDAEIDALALAEKEHPNA